MVIFYVWYGLDAIMRRFNCLNAHGKDAVVVVIFPRVIQNLQKGLKFPTVTKFFIIVYAYIHYKHTNICIYTCLVTIHREDLKFFANIPVHGKVIYPQPRPNLEIYNN